MQTDPYVVLEEVDRIEAGHERKMAFIHFV